MVLYGHQDRINRIRALGSPVFPFEPTISADGIWQFSPDDNSIYAKYLPFDHFVIHNLSTSNLKVEYRNNVMYVDGKTVREQDTVAFRILKITELSSANVTAGQLYIEISRKPMDADREARSRALNFMQDFSMRGGI